MEWNITAMTSAPDSPQTPLVRTRACGDCKVCCVVTTIDDPAIQKASGAACRHSLGGGCDIYETRPDVCRTFYCGWRQSKNIPEDWRPDRSGIFTMLEVNSLPQFKPVAVALTLVGDPLKIVRRTDFIDFVIDKVRAQIALYLVLPGTKGMKTARLPLNNPLILEAMGKSRADVKAVLEMMLKRLQDAPFAPHVMQNGGHDFST
jgi:hypothetical protein